MLMIRNKLLIMFVEIGNMLAMLLTHENYFQQKKKKQQYENRRIRIDFIRFYLSN